MKQTQFTTLTLTWRRALACALAVVLCAVAIAGFADTQTGEKHFTLEAATMEVSQDPDRPALSIKEIAKRSRPSIVGIATEATITYNDPFGGYYGYSRRQTPPTIRQSGAGSGIIISADGYILTNSHVVNSADSIRVYLSDGTDYPALLVGEDTINDMAILKIAAENLTPALFGDSSLLEVGELAVAIGNPLGEVNGSVTAGIISALERTLTIDGKDMTVLQTDAAINPGNSGGALINSFGEVIGIVTAKTSSISVEGIGYAIPVNHVKELVEQLVIDGEEALLEADAASGPMLGISIDVIDEERALQYGQRYGTDIPQGIYVLDVEPYSPAERAGIHIGDTILSLGGQEVKTHEDLTRVKGEIPQGVPQPLVVLRNGQEVELTIVLGTAQPKL